MASSSSTSSGANSQLVSASAYLSQAPQTPTTDTYTRDEIRRLVLEYLCSGCHASSASAFAIEVDERDRREKDGRQPEHGGKEARAGAKNGHDDGMEGVEATPEPESWRIDAKEHDDSIVVGGGGHEAGEADSDESRDADAIEVQQALRGLSTTNGGSVNHGKAVAFELREVDDSEDEDEEAELDRFEGTSMLSKEELRQIRLRRDIRDAILAGRIQTAVDLLKEHFPTVLSDPPITTSSSKSSVCSPNSFFVKTPSSAPPSVPRSSTSAATNASLGIPSRPGTPKPPVPILGATFGSWSLSLDPQILALNLQLQSFVELMRGAHSSTSVSSTPSTPTYTNGNGASLSDSHSDAGLSGSTASLTSSTHALNIAIAQSQALNSSVFALPPGRDRDRWEQECIDVSGLMAYKDLLTCPVRGYLAQERRDTLAEMVNAAILAHAGHTPLPILALAARSTTAVWSALAELKHPFVPAMGPVTKDTKSKHKVYPRFDLRTFLTETEAGPISEPATTSTSI